MEHFESEVRRDSKIEDEDLKNLEIELKKKQEKRIRKEEREAQRRALPFN